MSNMWKIMFLNSQTWKTILVQPKNRINTGKHHSHFPTYKMYKFRVQVAVFFMGDLTQSIEGKDLASLGKLTGVVFKKIIDEPTWMIKYGL